MKKIQMLVLDDHQLVLDGLKYVLADQYDLEHIEFVTSVEMALSSIEKRPKVDVLLTDLVLPNSSGFDLLEKISEMGLVIPSIILTSSEEAEDIKRAIDLGVSGFVPKSAGSTEIMRAVDSVIAGDMYLSSDALNVLELSSCDTEKDEKEAALDEETHLSARQIDTLKLIEQGFTNKQIASILEVSESTVKYHIKALFRRLDSSTRTGCVRAARERAYL